jgi:hypothetical protein
MLTIIAGWAVFGFSVWFFVTNKTWDIGGNQLLATIMLAAAGILLVIFGIIALIERRRR